MKRFLLVVAMVFISLTAEAQLVRSSALTVIKEELPPVELGWKHIVDGQLGTGLEDDWMAGIHYIAAYRFTENYLAGVGIGVESNQDGMICMLDDGDEFYINNEIDVAMPLYLHGRYYFATDRWSPYMGASAGIYFASKRAYLNNNWEGYEVTGDDPSFTSLFVDFNFGLNHRLGAEARNELSLYAGLKLMKQRYVVVAVLPQYDDSYPKSVGINNEGFDPFMGFYFGTSITF